MEENGEVWPLLTTVPGYFGGELGGEIRGRRREGFIAQPICQVKQILMMMMQHTKEKKGKFKCATTEVMISSYSIGWRMTRTSSNTVSGIASVTS